jgi:hypothetical protein
LVPETPAVQVQEISVQMQTYVAEDARGKPPRDLGGERSTWRVPRFLDSAASMPAACAVVSCLHLCKQQAPIRGGHAFRFSGGLATSGHNGLLLGGGLSTSAPDRANKKRAGFSSSITVSENNWSK